MKLLEVLIVFILLQLGCNQKPNYTEELNRDCLREELKELSNSRISSLDKIKYLDESKIEQNTKIIEMSDDKLETVLNQPMPSFTFIFPSQMKSEKNCNDGITKLDLPEDGILILKEYWNEAIRFRYFSVIKGDSLNQDQRNKLLEIHTKASDEFEDKIRKITITAPNGKRNISGFEVSQLTTIINSFAADVILKAIDARKSGKYQSV